MRRNSLFFTSKEEQGYSGNEAIQNKRADKYATDAYTWNERFINLMDAFFEGKVVHNITDSTYDLMEKYVSYANGSLSSNDKQYDLMQQFDAYLATQK